TLELSDALTTNHAGSARGSVRLTGAPQGRAQPRRLREKLFLGHRPRMPPCASVPDPLALIGPRPTGGYFRRDLLNFRREAAHSPSRDLTRTLRHGGEPAAVTGRPGGTDEFLGRGGFRLHSATAGQRPRRLTLQTCLALLRADARTGTSPVQQTRQSQQRSA